MEKNYIYQKKYHPILWWVFVGMGIFFLGILVLIAYIWKDFEWIAFVCVGIFQIEILLMYVWFCFLSSLGYVVYKKELFFIKKTSFFSYEADSLFLKDIENISARKKWFFWQTQDFWDLLIQSSGKKITLCYISRPFEESKQLLDLIQKS